MKTKRQIRKNVTQNYHYLLIRMHSEYVQNNNIPIQELLNEYKVSKGIPSALCKLGILQRVGQTKWMWIGRKPDMIMSLDLIEFLRKKGEYYNENNRGVNKQPVEVIIDEQPVEVEPEVIVKPRKKRTIVKPEVVAPKKTIKVSFLFGLITYQIN